MFTKNELVVIRAALVEHRQKALDLACKGLTGDGVGEYYLIDDLISDIDMHIIKEK